MPRNLDMSRKTPPGDVSQRYKSVNFGRERALLRLGWDQVNPPADWSYELVQGYLAHKKTPTP